MRQVCEGRDGRTKRVYTHTRRNSGNLNQADGCLLYGAELSKAAVVVIRTQSVHRAEPLRSGSPGLEQQRRRRRRRQRSTTGRRRRRRRQTWNRDHEDRTTTTTKTKNVEIFQRTKRGEKLLHADYKQGRRTKKKNNNKTQGRSFISFQPTFGT